MKVSWGSFFPPGAKIYFRKGPNPTADGPGGAGRAGRPRFLARLSNSLKKSVRACRGGVGGIRESFQRWPATDVCGV